jgi:hypothetical protein
MTPAQLSERQTMLELLTANYEILTGIVRRLATWENVNPEGVRSLLRRPESSSIAADLAGDVIPYLRRRLGLEPDPCLAELVQLLRLI